ncbi:MAG: 3-phosphoshikimate 1-carboxyvinyltransferase [Deltaproteobacteria bacterium]|nr:3-phosphoshikimate 1-carboxyvinyltransferase [Deltaproteobacteria bacterium]
MSEAAGSAQPLLRVGRSRPLRGSCRVPGDKSISHRALLFGALCGGGVEIRGLGSGGDNASTAAALRALGVSLRVAGSSARVEGVGFAGLRESTAPLDCGNSGTTMRLLAGLLAGRPFASTLSGDPSLSRRPMGRLAKPLRLMGARLDGRPDPARPDGILPPLTIRGGGLRGIDYALPVASAQLKSALVLAGLQASGRTSIQEPGLSRDHTERMLRFLGAPLGADPVARRIVVDPTGWNGKLRAAPVDVPGDLSSAAFLLVAAAIVPGSDVTVEGVGLNPTRTGVLDALAAMAANIEIEQTAEAMGEPVGRVRVRHAGSLRAARIAGALALRSLDEIPALAVAASVAQGRSEFADLAELRVKESDRIAAVVRELRRAGRDVEESPAGFTVMGSGGRAPRGGRVAPDRDHRIAMAGAVLALLSDEETLVPSEDIATSFPTFVEILRDLGAEIG